MSSNVNALACKLEKARRDQGLTYQEIADYIGKSRPYTWKLLTGKVTIRSECAEKMAELLGLDTETLLEPDPKINTRMPERFLSYIAARAEDLSLDTDTIIVNAVAAWIKQDVDSVKRQSHANAEMTRRRGRPRKD